MIEGGGLGVFKLEEVGPMSVQRANGVVDIAVKDETEAVAVAKQYLSYFQGPVRDWEAPDPRALRFVVPENRLRYYDMREVIAGIADLGSVLELRKASKPHSDSSAGFRSKSGKSSTSPQENSSLCPGVAMSCIHVASTPA